MAQKLADQAYWSFKVSVAVRLYNTINGLAYRYLAQD